MEIWASITSASKISDRSYTALQDALVTASSAVKFREKKRDLVRPWLQYRKGILSA